MSHIVIIIIVTISSFSVIITLGQYRLALGTLAGAGGKAREGGVARLANGGSASRGNQKTLYGFLSGPRHGTRAGCGQHARLYSRFAP